MLGDTSISKSSFCQSLTSLIILLATIRLSSFIYQMRSMRRVEPGRSVRPSNSFASAPRSFTDLQKRYGTPYIQCGCPLPGNTVGQKLARFVPLSGSKHYPPARLAPSADQPEMLAASHPSDHNTVAVLGLPNNSTAKAQRDNKALRRHEREVGRVRKGEITQEEFERNAGHATPFLVPVPLTLDAVLPVAPLGRVIRANEALGSFAGCATVCSRCINVAMNPPKYLFRTRAQLVLLGPPISAAASLRTRGPCKPK